MLRYYKNVRWPYAACGPCIATYYLMYFMLQFVVEALIDHLYYIGDLDLSSDWSTVLNFTSIRSDLQFIFLHYLTRCDGIHISLHTYTLVTNYCRLVFVESFTEFYCICDGFALIMFVDIVVNDLMSFSTLRIWRMLAYKFRLPNHLTNFGKIWYGMWDKYQHFWRILLTVACLTPCWSITKVHRYKILKVVCRTKQ